MDMPQKRFTIALSFPGEHRTFVEQVASALSSQIGKDRVLYDKYYEAEFARPNLDTHLQSLYHDDSGLIAVFLCEDYERKEWCGLEWRAIRDLIKKRHASSVMPFRFDMTEIPGLFSTDGYVWIDNRTPLEIAAVILKRLEVNTNSVAESQQALEAREVTAQAVTAPPPAQPTMPTSHAPADYNPTNRAFNVPFRPKGDQIIGRDDALQQVRDQLTQGKHTAIGHTAAFEGLGGLGKTQLAVEYAYRFKDCYPNGVIWINADQDINAQLTDIAVSARWIAPETEHKLKLDVALHRLRSFSDCLIIFDNVDDYAAIGPFLPLPTATPHLLATSRTALTGFKAIHLDQLDKSQSLQLLFQEAGRQAVGDDESEAAEKIVEQLDGLPLALELAGAYLCHRSTMSFAQYRDKLLSDPIKTLNNPYLASFTKHDADLFRTLKIDEDVVLEEPLLSDILDVLTWSGPAAMGLPLMASLLDEKETELSGALALGTQLKLLQKSSDNRYALHRLVREVRRFEQPLNGRNVWVDQVCSRLGDWFEEVRQQFKQLPVFEGEIDHLVAWLNNVEHMAPLHACRLTWLQSYPAYHRGMYLESQRYILWAQDIFNKNKLSDSVLLAHLLNDLGAIYICLGQDLKARNCVERALSIRLETVGEHHPDTIMSYNNLGLVLDLLGFRQQALENINKALKISSEYFGERYEDIARSYQNLGAVYWNLNDYKNALKYTENALELCRKHLGELDPLTATSYNSVGVMYSNAGNNNDALIHLEESLKIRYELFGENHPDTARSFNNVSNTYGTSGDHRNALKFQEKALLVRVKVLGESHPDTLSSYNNLGIHYENLDQYQDALRVQKKGHTLAKEVLPRKHPLLEKFEKDLRNVSEKLSRPGFRKPSLHNKKKKRK
ncbi:MAG: tetratricopeptide repeat protein [Chlorobiales bacterium]|nr:tetratricopeptide repeat protein [Chlorobiales bacterium]